MVGENDFSFRKKRKKNIIRGSKEKKLHLCGKERKQKFTGRMRTVCCEVLLYVCGEKKKYSCDRKKKKISKFSAIMSRKKKWSQFCLRHFLFYGKDR